jgi:hypothetical protein
MVLASLVGVASCTGIIGDGLEQAEPPPNVPLAPLRRLTRSEYDQTIAALTGASARPGTTFVPDEKVGPFDVNASAAVSEVLVDQYMDAAELVALELTQDVAAILPCDPSVDGEEPCARAFAREFGKRAYRRPLGDDEVERALGLWSAGKEGASFTDGIRVLIQGFLQSPYFLYHVELGQAPAPGESVVPLSGYELANRLSYFLWDSMPDEPLDAVAGDGSIADPQVLDAQVRRMLADPRSALGIGNFHVQWLGVDRLAEVEKDPLLFPAWSPELAAAMETETRMFSDWVVRQGDSTLATLLSAPTTFADGQLAALYGTTHPEGAGAAAFALVPLDEARRGGLLTQAGFLAVHAHPDQTSPVFRGALVRENFFCSALPPPPDDVDDTPPGLDPTIPTKERFEQHRADPACSGCHVLMDPIGFGFEHFDATGAWRDVDGDNPVDALGELVATDVDGEFDGARELAAKLAVSGSVRACLVHQWLRFALGRLEQPEDAVTEKKLSSAFASDGNLRELIVAIATSDTMRYLRIAEGGP